MTTQAFIYPLLNNYKQLWWVSYLLSTAQQHYTQSKHNSKHYSVHPRRNIQVSTTETSTHLYSTVILPQPSLAVSASSSSGSYSSTSFPFSAVGLFRFFPVVDPPASIATLATVLERFEESLSPPSSSEFSGFNVRTIKETLKYRR